MKLNFLVLLYLDPTTGSLLVQFLIASVTAVFIFFNQLKTKVKQLFNRIFKMNRE